jgi:hypothetical protein
MRLGKGHGTALYLARNRCGHTAQDVQLHAGKLGPWLVVRDGMNIVAALYEDPQPAARVRTIEVA